MTYEQTPPNFSHHSIDATTHLSYLQWRESTTTVLMITIGWFTLFSVVEAQQIYQCNGVWTNQPCPGGTSHFEEVVHTPSIDQIDKQKKNALVHQLVQARYRAKSTTGLDFDTSAVEKTCALTATTVADCSEKVAQAHRLLEDRLIESERVALQKRELELREAELKAKSQKNTTVVIQNIVVATPPPLVPTVGALPVPPEQLRPQATIHPGGPRRKRESSTERLSVRSP